MQTSYNGIPVPANGKPIDYANGVYTVPDHPIIPFIEGDGTGRDIGRPRSAYSTPQSQKPTAASARSRGTRSSPARRPIARLRTGCPTTPSRPPSTFASPSKAR